jgi:hypothetical protein
MDLTAGQEELEKEISDTKVIQSKNQLQTVQGHHDTGSGASPESSQGHSLVSRRDNSM